MTRNCVITGGGSGVGRAAALKLVREDWGVFIVGRRGEALEETIRLAGENAGRIASRVCDIGDAEAVEALGRGVLDEAGDIEVLVNAAGTNVRRRSLEELSLGDYHAMISANMNGAYYCTQAFLPKMRARQEGTIVNVVSDAGKQASPKAGPGYVMSKFGLAGLTQSINAEERAHGVRACAIFPGDIDTPLLDKRPKPPASEARARMIRPDDIAECIFFCINMPPNTVIEEMVVRPC